MGVALASDDDGASLTWAQLKMLEALRREQAARTERRRAAEARDRAEWIEGIRRRLGLVSEVHEYRTWQVGAEYWAWACLRPGCAYSEARSVNAEQSKARVVSRAAAHRRRYLPSAPESVAGAVLDLTGWGPTS
jgi:hypothetical protein